MPEFTEDLGAAEFMVSEANGNRSREAITVLSGRNLKPGAVLGKASHALSGTPAAGVGNIGNGVIGAVDVGLKGKTGVYMLALIEAGANAGSFSVEDPDGKTIGVAKVGAAFSKNGIGFTIADGAADFVAGDTFTVTVAAGSGKHKELDPAATDGSEVAVGVLYAAVDASGGDHAGVAIVRDAEVKASLLVWKAGMSIQEITDAVAVLTACGIIIR